MSIDPISTTTTTSPASAASAAAGGLQGTQDEFLKLFMAQLEHQDPLNPQSGADMASQLAQFSSVEQAQQTNQQLGDLVAAQSSQSSASLSTLVGRTCDAAAGDFTLERGATVPPLAIDSSGPMKGASVVITDANGNEVRRIPIPEGTTSTQIAWDGTNASGTQVPPGSYHVKIDAGTTPTSINSSWHGRIDAVELTADGPRLRMGGVLFAPGDVRSIGADDTSLTNGVHA